MKQKWKRIVSTLLVFVMVLSLAYVDMGTEEVKAASMTQKTSYLRVETAPMKGGDLVYNGNPQTLIVSGKAKQGFIIFYKIVGFSADDYVSEADYDSEYASYSTSLPQATEAGYYTVAYNGYSSANGLPSTQYEGVVEVQIAQRPVTATISGTATKTYDGTTAAPGLSITLNALANNTNSGVVGGEINATATYNYDNANAGTDKAVTASGIELVNANTNTDKVNNYKLVGSDETPLTSLVTTGTIEKASLQVEIIDSKSAEGIPSKSYDGTTTVTDTDRFTAKLSGSIASPDSTSDRLGTSVAYAYESASATAANNKINATVSLTGSSSQNYVLAGADSEGKVTKTIDASISVQSITDAVITLDHDSYTYDTKQHTPTVQSVTVNGKPLDKSEYDVSVNGQTDVNDGTPYELTVTVKGGNYTGTATTTWTIGKAEQPEAMAISGQKETVTYGDDGFVLSLTGAAGTGAVTWSTGDSENISIVDHHDGTCTVTPIKVTTGDNTVSVTVTKDGDGNYNGASRTYTFSIGKKDFTNTAVISLPTDFDQIYNGESQAVTVTDGGSMLTEGTDYEIVITADGEDKDTVMNAGSYTIEIVGTGNYTGTATAMWSIEKADQNSMAITGVPSSVRYGDSSFALGVSGVKGDDSIVTWGSSNTDVATIDAAGKVTIVGAGSTVITASHSGDDNYNSKQVTAEIKVDKATLTVTPESGQSKKFGDSDSEITYTVDGFVNNDTNAVLTGVLSRTVGNFPGQYEIILGTLTAANYNILFTAGVMFTIKENSDAFLEIETTDANGNVVVGRYNDSGLLVQRQVTDKNGNVTTEDYSKTGKIAELTIVDASGNTTEHRKYAENGSYVKDGFDPEIIEGSGTKYDGTNGIMVRSNDELINFLAVYINGTQIPSENYTVVSGSIKVTLKSSYLATLTPGTYSISIASTNGAAKGSFVIPEAKKTEHQTSNPPKEVEGKPVEKEDVVLPTDASDEKQAGDTSESETLVKDKPADDAQTELVASASTADESYTNKTDASADDESSAKKTVVASAAEESSTKKTVVASAAEESSVEEESASVEESSIEETGASVAEESSAEETGASVAEDPSVEEASALIAEEKGGSFGWIWLIILLLIAVAVAVGVFYKRSRNKSKI
jgi:hypothetical protein